MAETVKKAAAKAKETAEALSSAVASARTRSGEPKVTKPPPKPKAQPAPEPVKRDPVKLLDAFMEEQKVHRDAVDFPEDTGDAMMNAVDAYLYYQERISKAQLVQKHLKEG